MMDRELMVKNLQGDGGIYYGWWITGASFLCVAARRGSETAYSVLLVVLTAEFGWERATITGAFRSRCW
jgi:hypothetical protein